MTLVQRAEPELLARTSLERLASGSARSAWVGDGAEAVAKWPAAARRVIALDALRGLLALSVAVYHLSVWTRLFASGSVASSAVATLGVYSVEGFFVISGFCFAHVYGRVRFDGYELGRFHLARFARIAPLYYTAVALNLMLRQDVGPAFSVRKLLENVTLTFGLFHPNHAMVLGGWSIGIEYVFYLAFPLLVFSWRTRAGLYGGAALAVICTIPYTFGKVEAGIDWERFHAYVAIPNQAFLFFLGAIVADIRSRVHARFSTPALVAVLVLATAAAASTQATFHDHIEVMIGFARVKYVALCFVVVLSCALWRGPFGAARALLVSLGDLSYAIYLLHPFAWLATRTVLGAHGTSLARFATAIACSLALAWFAHRYIERPAMRAGRRISAGFERPSTSAA